MTTPRTQDALRGPDTQDGSAGFAQYQATKHFASLNGLRFLCIAAVLWHHAPIWTDMVNPPQLLTRGFLGVDYFFVLSGFLITTLMLREDAATGRFSLKGFYWRRILRIVPIYFGIVTAVGAYYIFVKGQTEYLTHWPYYYLFLSNFLTDHIPLLAPTWSLSVEEQYYMVWPLVFLLVPRRMIPALLVVLVALNLLAVTGALRLVGVVPFDAGVLRFEMFTATYAPILLGTLLAIALHNPRGYAVLARLLGQRITPVVLLVLLLAAIQLLPAQLAGWPNLVLHLVMTAGLASIVLQEDHILRPLMTLRPIARIGAISYGIYLYHLIGLHIANTLLAAFGVSQTWLSFCLYLLLTFLIAEVSFRSFESWFLGMRYRK